MSFLVSSNSLGFAKNSCRSRLSASPRSSALLFKVQWRKLLRDGGHLARFRAESNSTESLSNGPLKKGMLDHVLLRSISDCCVLSLEPGVRFSNSSKMTMPKE